MDTPEERVKTATRESGRLKEYLGSLPYEAWSKPSACKLWEVRDVVAHLACVAEGYLEWIHRSLTPEGQPAAGPVSAASFAEGNAERAILKRTNLGDQVFTDFIATNDQLIQLMATLGPQDWEKPHYYASLGTEPMRYRPDLWISELAMHGWDIRSRFETEVHLSDDSLPVMMDVLRGNSQDLYLVPARAYPSPFVTAGS